jgi:hypothetical protein
MHLWRSLSASCPSFNCLIDQVLKAWRPGAQMRPATWCSFEKSHQTAIVGAIKTLCSVRRILIIYEEKKSQTLTHVMWIGLNNNRKPSYTAWGNLLARRNTSNSIFLKKVELEIFLRVSKFPEVDQQNPTTTSLVRPYSSMDQQNPTTTSLVRPYSSIPMIRSQKHWYEPCDNLKSMHTGDRILLRHFN